MKPPRAWSGSSRTRAEQLWQCGWGGHRVRSIMLAEGWHQDRLPSVAVIAKVLMRDLGRPRSVTCPNWPPEPSVPIEDDPPEFAVEPNQPAPPVEPDILWLRSLKRCPLCYGVSAGDRCPQGHLFPGQEPRKEEP